MNGGRISAERIGYQQNVVPTPQTLKQLCHQLAVAMITTWNHFSTQAGWLAVTIDVEGTKMFLSTYSSEGVEAPKTLHELILDDNGKRVCIASADKPNHCNFVDIVMTFAHTKHNWLMGKDIQTFTCVK